MEMGQEYIPVHKHWRLNERSYGDLVGLNKKEVVKKFGKDQVKRWRRSYDEPPPPMSEEHDHHPKFDPRYRFVRVHLLQRYCCSFNIFFCFQCRKVIMNDFFVIFLADA